MIINGGSRVNNSWFAKHLVNVEKNEQVTLAEVRGLAAEDVGSALREMQAIASGTRCKNFFYHVNINPRDDELLTPTQWGKAVDTLERNLGLEGHARFVVEHSKFGRTHRHVVWSRIDVERMRAVRMDNDYEKHQATARKLEKEFDLARVASVLGGEREGPRPERRPDQWEVFRGKESGIDPNSMKVEVTALWQSTASGQEFAAALESRGYVLARGDRRDFCIIDQVGHEHSLSRRIDGAKAADIRARMADVDRQALPSVEQGKELQRTRYQQSGQGDKAMPQGQELDKGPGQEAAWQEEEKRTEANKKEIERQEEARKGEEERQEQARKDDERRQQQGKEEDQKREATQKEEERTQQDRKGEEERQAQARQEEERRQQQGKEEEESSRKAFQEQADRQSEQARIMEQQQRQRDSYKAHLARLAEEGKRNQGGERQEGQGGDAQELEIRNPNYRYGQALGQHYDVFNPYQSLARAAMAEYGAFIRDREKIDQQIAQAKDPATRQGLELRKRIEAAEYMAITSDRIAGQSEVIAGRMNTEEAVRQRGRATEFKEEAQELRKEYREINQTRDRGEGTKSVEAAQEPAKKPNAPGNDNRELMVEERTPGKPRGEPQGLYDFVWGLPPAPEQALQPLPQKPAKNDPAAVRERYVKMVAEQKRESALNRIGEDMRAGRNLGAGDVRNLSPADHEGIRAHGDSYLEQLTQQRERTRERSMER